MPPPVSEIIIIGIKMATQDSQVKLPVPEEATQDSQVKLPEEATQDSQVQLPDEVWSQILSKLSCKDLCSISMTCKDLHRISDDDSLWSPLLSSGFSKKPLPNLSAKSNYRYRLQIEKDIAKHISEKLKLKKQEKERMKLELEDDTKERRIHLKNWQEKQQRIQDLKDLRAATGRGGRRQ